MLLPAVRGESNWLTWLALALRGVQPVACERRLGSRLATARMERIWACNTPRRLTLRPWSPPCFWEGRLTPAPKWYKEILEDSLLVLVSPSVNKREYRPERQRGPRDNHASHRPITCAITNIVGPHAISTSAPRTWRMST
jgi:hypothetical protein